MSDFDSEIDAVMARAMQEVERSKRIVEAIDEESAEIHKWRNDNGIKEGLAERVLDNISPEGRKIMEEDRRLLTRELEELEAPPGEESGGGEPQKRRRRDFI